jgi:hypothetical protein
MVDLPEPEGALTMINLPRLLFFFFIIQDVYIGKKLLEMPRNFVQKFYDLFFYRLEM